MRRLFHRRAVLNAYGESAETAVERPFRRMLRVYCLVAAALVVVGGVALGWASSRTVDARLRKMEADASRLIADALDSPARDVIGVLENGRETMDRWRESLRTIGPETTVRQDRILLRMYAFQSNAIPRWIGMLGPQEGKVADLFPFEERYNRFRTELLAERDEWPPPPAPGFTLVVSEGVSRALDGILEGVCWPFRAGKRAWECYRPGAPAVSFGKKMRYIVFPWTLFALSFPWLIGLGFMAAAVGYFLCWLGMKADSLFLSFLGLLYFLFIVVIVVCIFLLLAGVLA